jgi:hypothetical protein
VRPLSQAGYDTAIEWMQDLAATGNVMVRVPKPFERIDLLAPTLADATRLPPHVDALRHVRRVSRTRDDRPLRRLPQGPIRRRSMPGIL